MTDIHDTPAVPPQDAGGDDRVGLYLAGAILIVLGWGVAVALNLLLHADAPAGGWMIGPARVSAHLGTYAWATAAFGAVTGLVGAVMLLVARQYPPGPLVLPGASY